MRSINKKDFNSLPFVTYGTPKETGVKFNFIPTGKKKSLKLRLCSIIQKHLKIKSGDRLDVKSHAKNDFLLLIVKSTHGYKFNVLRSGQSGKVCFTWNLSEPNENLKLNQHANYKLLEDNELLIDLLKNDEIYSNWLY